MSEVCRFRGAVIQIFYRDHAPPHFHVRYAGRRARFAIDRVHMLDGALPPHIQRLVLDWAQVRQVELEQAWARAQSGEQPGKIAPLS